MSLSVSKVPASNHCGRFRSGNPKLQGPAPPLTLNQKYEARRNANLNPNKLAHPLCSQSMRLFACACGPSSEATRRRRNQYQVRTAPPMLTTGYIQANRACDFAEVVYFAYMHAQAFGSSIVQSQLAHGVRYSLAGNQRRSVLLETPQGNYLYTSGASLVSIVAALPGAYRAATQAAQKVFREAIAIWWLGEEQAAVTLTALEDSATCSTAANSVPLEPTVSNSIVFPPQ